jgi:hypoxanthine phosphoribosyltransferase
MHVEEVQALPGSAEQLYGQEAIDAALDRMAEQITRALGGTRPLALCNLTGGIIPFGHLLTRLHFPLEIDYLHVTRYRGDTRGGERIDWLNRPTIPLAGREVLLFDDILDEGHTLAAVQEYCRAEGAAGIYTAVMVRKHHERGIEVRADSVGLEVEDRYVFGFGMDYRGWFRNLHGIYAIGGEGG